MVHCEQQAVEEMLERLGKAVSDGNLPGISACYAFPAFFLIGEQVTVLNEALQLEELFAEGRRWYVSQGVETTKAEILRIDAMTETLLAIDVRWPGFNSGGQEIYSETSHYILQTVNGEPRIRVALSRTIQPPITV